MLLFTILDIIAAGIKCLLVMRNITRSLSIIEIYKDISFLSHNFISFFEFKGKNDSFKQCNVIWRQIFLSSMRWRPEMGRVVFPNSNCSVYSFWKKFESFV